MPGCPGCPPIWDTPNPDTPTDICPPHPSSSSWPRNAWQEAQGTSDEPARADPADVLHRPARAAAPSQPRTVAAYRDTFRLLLAFTKTRTGTAPSKLTFQDLDAATITAFLDHLETERGNTTRTRNARLAALRSLFRYAAFAIPNTPP